MRNEDDALDVNEERLQTGLRFLFLILPLLCWPAFLWQFTLTKLVLIQLFAYLFFSFWVFSLSAGGKTRWGLPHYLVAAFLILMTVSSFTALSPAVAVLGKYGRYQGLLTYSSYALLFFLASQVSWLKNKRLFNLLLFSSISLTAVSVYGIIQYLGLDPINWGSHAFGNARVFSTLGNPNYLGSYLALSLPLALGLYLREDGPRKLIYGLPLILGGVSLVITYSRGAWLSGAIGLLVLLYLERKRLLSRFNIRALILPVVGIGIAIFLSIALGNQDYFVDRAKSIFDPGSGTFAERLEIWKAAAEATRDRPLLGFGPDNFRYVFPRYLTEAYVSASGRGVLQNDAHNYLLQLSSTLGIPAALLFVVVCIVGLGKSRRLLSELKAAEDSILVSAVVASIVAYLVNILLTVNPVGPAALFWVLLGVLAFASPVKEVRLKSEAVLFAGVVTAIVLVVFVIINVSTMAADWHYKTGMIRLSNGFEDEAIAEFKQAQGLNPFIDQYAFKLGEVWLNRAVSRRESADFEQAIRLFETTLRIAAYETNNHLFLGQTLFFAGQSDPEYLNRAIMVIDDGLRLQPLSQSMLYVRAAIEHEIGDFRKAETTVKTALSLNQNYAQAQELLGLISEELGKDNQAIDAYEKAVSLDSGLQTASARLRHLR